MSTIAALSGPFPSPSKSILLMPASRPANSLASVETRCVRLNAKAGDVASLAPVVERRMLSWADNEVLIEVRAISIERYTLRAWRGGELVAGVSDI